MPERIRPILYGVSDYAEIRKANAWFVDRTAKLRDLEQTRFAMFLRPRRFGKVATAGGGRICEPTSRRPGLPWRRMPAGGNGGRLKLVPCGYALASPLRIASMASASGGRMIFRNII